MDVFPFSDSDDFGEPKLEMIDGAFGDVFHAFHHPILNPIHPSVVPADLNNPEHKRIYYRLLTRFRYLREKQLFSRCNKRKDLTAIFVLLEFFKDTKRIRWTRLPDGEHDVAWRRTSSIVRERAVNFVANAHKVRLKACRCTPWVQINGQGQNPSEAYPTCTQFVYPEYEAALQKAERESRAPWGYEMDVFMHLRRTLGNDMARLIIGCL
jgi:hypothetical protein